MTDGESRLRALERRITALEKVTLENAKQVVDSQSDGQFFSVVTNQQIHKIRVGLCQLQDHLNEIKSWVGKLQTDVAKESE